MRNKSKSILIVGGTGFIGYHLAKKSLKKKLKVTSISTNPPLKKRKLKKVKYIYCDITKKNFLKKKISKYYDYVVNLGGYVDHTNKKKTYESHFNGCKNLANIFLKHKPKSFVQIGSSVEYGNFKSPHKENLKNSPVKLKSIYGKAKLLSSIYLIKLFNKVDFPITILRLYLCYGPTQSKNRFLPIIIDGCLKNKKFPCSNGMQFRDFIYVDDVVDAIFKVFKNKKARGEIINLGSGKPKKIKKIILFIKNFLKSGMPQFGDIALRKDEIIMMYPSINKAKKILNWKPKVNFLSGLKKTIKYYKNDD